MDDLLPKAALIALDKAKNKLGLGKPVKVRASSSWLKKTSVWCSEHEIILGHGDSEYFYISNDGIIAIEQRYRQLDQGTLHQHANVIDNNRVNSSKVTDNEKLAKILPTENLVLTANSDFNFRQLQQSLCGLIKVPLQVNHELDVSIIDFSLFDYLIVVENRDCFNEWYKYQIESSITRPLIVYRGHEKSHSKGCIALKSRWLVEKGNTGQVYFGDFDIDGLAIAVDSKIPYQHLLFPSLNYLNEHLRTFQFDADNAYRLRELISRCPHQWQLLLDLLLTQQAGLRQQKMFEIELTLH